MAKPTAVSTAAPSIVMKFGGSSLASPTLIRHVAGIVSSAAQRRPVVVVSAFGDTTDHLASIYQHASRGEAYLSRKVQDQLCCFHLCMAKDLVAGEILKALQVFINQQFHRLNVRMLQIADGELTPNAELQDWVLSVGEQLASRIFAASLNRWEMPAGQLDARQLILTDAQFTPARVQTWETYARIRWNLPFAARDRVVVLGGFIASTSDGRTTTLGRGGSDLTASLVGSALNVEEIQVWKDVPGMLTWNPRLRSGAACVRRLSYQEAAELARAGATILHPGTIAPAERLRIPVRICHTFHPAGEGTRIGPRLSTGVIKSMTVSETSAATSLITLVGDGIAHAAMVRLVDHILPFRECVVLPVSSSQSMIRIATPKHTVTACLDVLQHAFFSVLDPALFAQPAPEESLHWQSWLRPYAESTAAAVPLRAHS